MTHTLFIQDRMLSSWSLRGHLLMEIAGLPYGARLVPGGRPSFAGPMGRAAAPARPPPTPPPPLILLLSRPPPTTLRPCSLSG